MIHGPVTPEVALAYEIAGTADAVLQDAEEVDFTQRYKCGLGDDYSLELRVHGATGNSPFARRSPSRYLYVNVPTVDCQKAVFTVDLNSFGGDQDVRGIVTDPYHLASAAEAIGPDKADEKELLLEMLRVIQTHDQAGGVTKEETATLSELYFALIDQGSSMVFRQESLKIVDQSNIWVSSTTTDGPAEHLMAWQTERPRLFVAVTTDDDPMRTVFMQSPSGLQESYTELADTMERMAGYADDKDIDRDEAGIVIGISGTLGREKAVVEAERAAGVRDLDIQQLEFINRSLQQALNHK